MQLGATAVGAVAIFVGLTILNDPLPSIADTAQAICWSANTYDVEIYGAGVGAQGFLPEDLTITEGDYVHWYNAGPADHTTTSYPHWDSGRLDINEEFSRRFCSVGTFFYSCTIHSDMQGAIRVNACNNCD